MKTKLFLDFDGTIFETQHLKERIFQIFEEEGFGIEEILKAYCDECRDFHFSLDRFCTRFESIKQYDRDRVHKKIDQMYSSETCRWIFSDFTPFIKAVDRDKYEVNILTLGNISFQKRKVESCQIVNYFDNIYYTEDQKWEYLKMLVNAKDNFIFIDDRNDAIYKVQQEFPESTCLCINRKLKDTDDPMLKKDKFEVLEIKTFNDALTYLK
jgi:FMN phosphatase YigB (HAD superfamily)